MGRKRLDLDRPPSDPKDLQRMVEEIVNQSSDKTMKAIQRLPKKRDACFDPEYTNKVDCRGHRHRYALIAHSRGAIAEIACDFCRDNPTPFLECVLLDSYLDAQCTNEWYLGHSLRDQSCSLATEQRAELARTTKQAMFPATSSKREHRAMTDSELESGEEPVKRSRGPLDYGTGSDDEEIVIIGSLKLPNPRKCGFQQDDLERIEGILKDLHQLDGRNLDDLKDRVDIETAFQKFQKNEQKAWNESGEEPEAGSSLVRPSGSLDSPIAHHMNQPSFTTINIQIGEVGEVKEVGDPNNPCVAMVMGNGFEKGTLIFDHLHRRSRDCKGVANLPKPVLDVHEAFTLALSGSALAKLEIVYGAKIRDRILKACDCTLLPLWGSYKDFYLTMLSESQFHNADNRYRFRKVLLFAAHPEHLFYQPTSGDVLSRQDRILEIANLILDNTVPFQTDYYTKKRWYSVIPSIASIALRQALKTQKTIDARGVEIPQKNPSTLDGNFQPATEPAGRWDHYFKDNPHSNDECRKLLPPAINAIKDVLDRNLAKWDNPSQLPTEIFNWFRGQKAILFHDVLVHGIDDIVKVLEKCKHANPQFNDESKAYSSIPTNNLARLLYELMILQDEHLRTRKGQNQDLKYSRMDGCTVETVCPCGRYKTVDEEPWFTTARNGRMYVMRFSRRCKVGDCTGIFNLRATSASLESVFPDRGSLVAEFAANKKPKYFRLIRADDDLPLTAASVELYCKHCTIKSQFLSSKSRAIQNTYLDNSAKWTIGNRRPLYVTRRADCLRCGRMDRDLVPVDEQIPFTIPGRMRTFVDTFEQFDDVVLAAILDGWPSTPRKPKIKGDGNGDDYY